VSLSTASSTELRDMRAELDRLVVKAARPVRVLTALGWPENVEARFLRSVRLGAPDSPRVKLTPPSGLPDDLDYAALIRRFDRGDPVQDWLARTVESARAGADLLRSIGTSAFTERSLEIYGRPSDPVHPGAPSALAAARHFLRATARLRVDTPPPELSDEEAIEWLRPRIEVAFPDSPPRLELDPGMASLASAGSTRIRLRQGARFSRVQLRQLLHHEALVHTATRRNGKGQPVLKSLGLSLPRTTATQEGLASLAELVSDAMDLTRLRRIALRVVAIQDALDGASFVEIWARFRAAGQSDEESYHSTRRIFRGGDGTPGHGVFAKDAVYVRGLVRVQGFLLTAIRDGHKTLPLRLFSGRLTSGDVVDLTQAFEEGTITPPAIAPRWVRNLDCLAAFLTVGGLMARVDLDAVDLESFTDR